MDIGDYPEVPMGTSRLGLPVECTFPLLWLRAWRELMFPWLLVGRFHQTGYIGLRGRQPHSLSLSNRESDNCSRTAQFSCMAPNGSVQSEHLKHFCWRFEWLQNCFFSWSSKLSWAAQSQGPDKNLRRKGKWSHYPSGLSHKTEPEC